MKAWLAMVLVIASGSARAQAVLDLTPSTDLAFQRGAVETFAERDYRRNLEILGERGLLDRDPRLLARLAPLMARVAAASAIENPASASLRWEIHTCRKCGESASAMAGGKRLVGEEFVADRALGDDELGFVLAHEAGHVVAEHTREFATVARYFLDNGLKREYWDIQRELDGSFRAQLRMAFVFARQEEEADRIGFVLGAHAGFAPEAMLTLLGKLGAEPASSGFGSHPTGERRLEQARAMLATAQAVHERRIASR